MPDFPAFYSVLILFCGCSAVTVKTENESKRVYCHKNAYYGKKYLYAKTKAKLDKKYKKFAKQIASGTYTETRKQTVGEYMLNWLTTYKKIELKPKVYNDSSSDYPLFQGNAVLSRHP